MIAPPAAPGTGLYALALYLIGRRVIDHQEAR